MRRRLLVVADTDSYLKWGAALASRLPDAWDAEIAIVRTPVAPSARQIGAALAGSSFGPEEVRAAGIDDLPALVRGRGADAVLLALRGPMVRLVAPVLAGLPDRPVLLSGFPGLTIPAVPKAIVFRELVDLIVLHSRREVRDFRALAERMPIGVGFGLATLPFLEPSATAEASAAEHGRDSVVFAAQAKVPAAYEDRVRLLGWLVEAARARPERRFVIKVRARAGEAQTHAERYPLPDLLDEPSVREGIGAVPANLTVEDGPMAAQLDRAAALVTVSSTAALEAVARGIPVLLLDDFGVGAATITEVFDGSGLLADHRELIAGRYRRPRPDWLADNYFHGGEHDDWAVALDALALVRDRRELPSRTRAHNLRGGALRAAYERRKELGEFDGRPLGAVAMTLGRPIRFVLRRVARVRAVVRRGS